MKEKLKILSFNKGALVDNYLNNPNDLYAPTHIFPLIDPEPDAHYNEYKSWTESDKLYKDHWSQPYMISQLDAQNDIHFNGENKFESLLNKDVTVEAGDLLVSNGDGTAKKQDDDIIRSKTVAKVNSNIKVETYSDGSYTVPCTLHC